MDIRNRRNFGILTGCLIGITCITCALAWIGSGILYALNNHEVLGGMFTPLMITESTPLSMSGNSKLPAEPFPMLTNEPNPMTPTNRPGMPLTPVTTLPEPLLVSPATPSSQEAANTMAHSNLATLLAGDYPPRDYAEAAVRLGKLQMERDLLAPEPHYVGEHRIFYTDLDEIEAELIVITDQFYFWMETSLNLDHSQLELSAQRFEEEFLPKIDKMFGNRTQEREVDYPRFSVLHLDGYADNSELGFFNSGDQYPQSVNERSNEKDLIYLNMKNLELGNDLYFGTMAHEYQHLIHWLVDPNETVWLSEGLAQLTEVAIGLSTADSAYDFWSMPGTQLNDWNHGEEDELLAHYGAAYMFLLYIWEQLGDEAIHDLFIEPSNGMSAVAKVLSKYQPELTLEEFVGNWTVANFLNDESYGQRFHYDHLQITNQQPIKSTSTYPFEFSNSLNQYASDFIDLEINGPFTLAFEGSDDQKLVQSDLETSDKFWFSPAMNELDATLTTSVDLVDKAIPVLRFKVWYELETNYDFTYISVSANQGESWELLTPLHAVNGEYGPAFGGNSFSYSDHNNGWLQEEISLAQYTGQEVLIRFETLTDSAEEGSGVAIGDIILTSSDEELALTNADSNWENKGFVYLGSSLPQLWRLQLIENGENGKITLLPLNDQNDGTWEINLGDEGGTLVVTALTPFSFTPGSYRVTINQPGSP